MENITATNTGFLAENMNVSGEQIAGNDINNNFYYENENGFILINTDQYGEDHYLSPVFTDEITERILNKRLVVIAGGTGFDKDAFVRHVAFRLISSSAATGAKEWSDTEEAHEFLKEIKEEKKERTVFILNNAVPLQINFDLAQLAALAKQFGHYILLTTEIIAEVWQQPAPVISMYWFQIPLTGLYSKEKLAAFFLQRLNRESVLFGLETEAGPEIILDGKFSIPELVSVIDSPDQIDFFFLLIEAESPDIPLAQKISNAIGMIADKNETLVTKWYRTLSPSEKLIALGAALLDGLFDDQYFAVMQRIAEVSWHHRENLLRSLDYCDLDFLLNFFKFEEYDNGRLVLSGKFPGQRAEIIRAAWSGHKRHILSAFTVITNLAGSSSAYSSRKIADAEINGSVERGKRLRAVAAETISDIGIVSLQTAEPKLLELAASGDLTTRRITAKAMARWRSFAREDQMFDTLEHWKEKRQSNIRATTVFTLQYAADYDSPGALHSRLIQLLTDLSDDPAAFSAMKDILPRLIDHHLFQIRNLLADYFAIHEKYAETITSAFVKMYSLQPLLVKQILEEWLANSFPQASEANRRQKPTFRDNIVMLVMKVFQRIPYTGENDVIPIDYVWNILSGLHNQEQRKTMRAFLLQTAASLISVRPEQVVGYIEPIFRRIGTEERMSMIKAIGDLYLMQRASLPQGEYYAQKNGVDFPLWRSQQRPLTRIETILYAWLTGNHSFSREIATLAFCEFVRVFDHEEPALLQTAIQQEANRQRNEAYRVMQQEQARRAEAKVTFPELPSLSLWTRIKIFFWLFFKNESDKQVLREVMNVMLMYKQIHPVLLNTLINRYSNSRNDNVRLVAWWLIKLRGL